MAHKKKGPTMTTWTPVKIKSLRAALGESQEEFSHRFRVTVDSVRAWEQGKGSPGGPSTVLLDMIAEEAERLASAS